METEDMENGNRKLKQKTEAKSETEKLKLGNGRQSWLH